MHLLNRLCWRCSEEEVRWRLSGRRLSVWAKTQQTDGSTLPFLTFRTSIGQKMRWLKQVCKESALKPSNPFVLATRRLPPATPCGPGVLTVCCRSPHAWSRRSYDKQYLKMTMPTLFGGPTSTVYDWRRQQEAVQTRWPAFASHTAVWAT